MECQSLRRWRWSGGGCFSTRIIHSGQFAHKVSRSAPALDVTLGHQLLISSDYGAARNCELSRENSRRWQAQIGVELPTDDALAYLFAQLHEQWLLRMALQGQSNGSEVFQIGLVKF